MCRIAYFPPGSRIDNPDAVRLMDFLVADNGGHGAGLGRVLNKEVQLIKGVDKKPEELVAFAKAQKEWDKTGWLFHTRVASIGPKVDALVQPIVADRGILVHNGHWNDWEAAFWPLALTGGFKTRPHVNDSVTAAEIANRLGVRALRWIGSGVFVWWGENGKVTLCKNAGEFAVSSFRASEGGGVVFASTFPEGWGNVIKTISPGSIVELGQEIPETVGDEITGRTTRSFYGRRDADNGYEGLYAQ